jgi:transposase
MLMADKEEIVYIDETSFHLWMQPSRCWVTRDMTLTIPTERGKSLTLIGALSQRRGLIHYSIFEGSNNTETFLEFLQRLKLKCREPAVVVQDNLQVHKAAAVMALYTPAFRHMFLPTYSSVLNPIERVWNVVKQEWKKTQNLHANQEYLDDDRARYQIARLQAIVGKVLKDLTSERS